MRHIVFQESERYPVALLIKTSYFKQYELQRHYLDRLQPQITPEQVIAFDLEYGGKKKVSAAYARAYLEDLMPELRALGCQYLYCCDAEYFKVLTKQTKADAHIGYVLPCKLKGFEDMQVVFGVNYGQLTYNPEPTLQKLDLTLDALSSALHGTYKELGTDIIQYAHYPESTQDIAAALESLHQYDTLAADIETFSLHPFKAGVGTIAFAWNQHEGIAFACDYKPHTKNEQGHFGQAVLNKQVRFHLKNFLEAYQGTLRWHNASFDIRSLIATLWMQHPKDYEGMLKGLDVLYRLMDDTMVIAYLATNSTAGNKLSLKDLAHEFAGNYAQEEIKDIRRIPLPELLEYNLVDVLCTNYVYSKLYPVMVEDNQEELYQSLMLPALKVITQMELTGMPMEPVAIEEAKQALVEEEQGYLSVLASSPIVRHLEDRLTMEAWEKDYQDRKAKAVNPDKIQRKDWDTFPRHEFNPNSGPQLQKLLYEEMGLPVIDHTKTRQPATGGDTLEKLLNHTEDPHYLLILEALVGLAGVSKILSDFMPRFEEALDKGDERVWLHGSFNLGGTVSGRLSSSKPNLQNLPSGSQYGKLIKGCFQAPKGWIMCGADFASLEDRINALLTKDPNKLAVYTQGFDGHALRAYAYWPEQFPDIDPTDPKSINTIKEQDHPLRQKSKTPTFALTYQGTWMTMVKNGGFTEEEAKKVEKAYHELYQVSDEWVKAGIAEAARKGYAEVAFGLRIRTPLLHQSILGHRTTPRESDAEARTLGNALSGQSYGLLNTRAANAVMEQVWASEFRYDILPIAHIHDAQYFLVRDRVDAVAFLNEILIKEMEWQELPEIQHPEVKLGANLDLFWPSWAESLELPNNATEEEIQELVREYLNQEHKEAA